MKSQAYAHKVKAWKKRRLISFRWAKNKFRISTIKITRDCKTSIEAVRFVVILILLIVVTACAQPQTTDVLPTENEQVTPPIEIEITKCYVASDGPHMSMRFKNNLDDYLELNYKIRIFSDTTKLVRPDPLNPPKEWQNFYESLGWESPWSQFDYYHGETYYDRFLKPYYLDENLLYEKTGYDTLGVLKEFDFNNWTDGYPIQKNTLPKNDEIHTQGVRCTFMSIGDDFSTQLFPFISSAGKY